MKNAINRRSFIRSATVIPAGLSLSNLTVLGTPSDGSSKLKPGFTAEDHQPSDLPMISLGGHEISRLITGSNTINAGSHLSHLVNHSMRDYFTEENVFNYFSSCLSQGINTFQGSNVRNFELWNQSKKEGETRHYISLIKEKSGKNGITIEYAKKNNFLGVAHHGEVTDNMFKKGKLGKIEDFCKKIRDSGLQVGVSTHMPDVIDYIEDKNWDIDFYMTCVYERHRTEEDLRKLLGYVPLPVGEVYLEEDPPRMYKMIRQTKKTCLAFKILAAGRVCDRANLLEQAFENTFSNIKENDAVIVGMFPRWADQIKENADLVRQFGKSSIAK